MGSAVDSVVEIGSFGLIDDFSGAGAAGDAAREAGNIQADAAGRTEDGINRRFDISQANLQPAMDAGNLARTQQLDMLGLNGTEAQTASMNSLTESPAQQFLRERAQKNLLQNAAAIGGVGGGDVRSALVEQGAGFAAQDIDNQFNRLGTLSGAGNAATNTSVNAGANAADSAGQAIMAGGQAQASGILGAQQAQANANSQFYQLAGMGAGALVGGVPGAQVGGQIGGLL